MTMKNTIFMLICFCSASCLLLPGTSFSEFYRYVTRDGQTFYVDDLSKVPEEYLDELKVYTERYDHLPPEEKAMMLQRDREEDQQRVFEEEQRRREREKEAMRKRLETDVIIQGNQVLVPVTVGNGYTEVRALLLLDTGASQLVLFDDLAARLNAKPHRKGISMVAGGNLIETGLTKLDYLKVGPLTIKDVPASIIKQEIGTGGDVEFNGLLGMSILRNIKYTIDFEAKKIRWQPS